MTNIVHYELHYLCYNIDILLHSKECLKPLQDADCRKNDTP